MSVQNIQKDAQWAETIDVLKIAYHIISRLGVMGIQKGRFERPKIQFPSKVVKFAVLIRIDLALIFFINDFFGATVSFEI